MLKKTIIYLLLLSLAGCSGSGDSKTNENQSVEKQPFYIDVYDDELNNGGNYIEKIGKVSAASDIVLASDASGKIRSLNAEIGQKVSAGQVLGRITDTGVNYDIALDRANNAVKSAKLQYDSQVVSYDTQVSQLELDIKNLESDLEAAKKSNKNSIDIAQQAVDDTNLSDEDKELKNQSKLAIEQLDKNIEKSKLDYENKVEADNQTILSYNDSLEKQWNTFDTLLSEVIYFGDSLLGVTKENSDLNNSFEQYLGAQNSTVKNTAENQLLDLIAFSKSEEYITIKNEVQTNGISIENLESTSVMLDTGFSKTQNFLNSLQSTITNSIPSLGALSQEKINGMLGNVSSYNSRLQQLYANFGNIRSNLRSFLETYKQGQESILKSIELQKTQRDLEVEKLQSSEKSALKNLDQAQISADNNIRNIEKQLAVLRNNLSNLKKTRDIALANQKVAIETAQINAKGAAKDFEKLILRSPITGSIKSVELDVGAQVSPGTPVVHIVSSGKTQIEIALRADEKSRVSIGEEVTILSGDSSVKGVITNIGDVADDNLLYGVTISIEGSQSSNIGKIATVRIPVSLGGVFLPINAVKTNIDGSATVQTLTVENEVKPMQVGLGETVGEKIEIKECMYSQSESDDKETLEGETAENDDNQNKTDNVPCSEVRFILSDLTNYNSEYFYLETSKTGK